MEELLWKFIEQYMPLTPEEKEGMLALDIFHHFDEGTVLLREGQYSTTGYFVVKGCVRTYVVTDGIEKTTEFYCEGETFSPPCAVTKQASSLYISCVEDSLLVMADDSIVEASFEKFPRFVNLCRIIAEEKLAAAQTQLEDFKTSSPEERYLHLLEARPQLLNRVPQYYLASYLGITPQSLSRMRARLAKKSV